MPRTRPWEVSDELWERVKLLMPEPPSHAKGGRPRIEDRKAFEAIVYMLRTGMQWRNLVLQSHLCPQDGRIGGGEHA
jgi:putative transposase